MYGPQLHVARYDNARTALLENIDAPANVGVRWALPGGLQRMEVTVKARSRHDAYERFARHLGNGMVLYDDWRGMYGDGWVFEVVPDGRHVHYVVEGAWKRLGMKYTSTAPGSGKSTDTYLKERLAGNASEIVNSDHSNIRATGVTMDGWLPNVDTGTKLDQIIRDILRMGVSTSGAILDFWFTTGGWNGLLPGLPLPILAARSGADHADNFQVDMRDLRDATMGRNIYDLANVVTVYYSKITLLNGAHSAGATTLTVDSTTDFAAGQEIEIQLNDSRRHSTSVDSVPSGTSITITDDLPHSAPDDGYVWIRSPLVATATASDSASQGAYWLAQHRVADPGLYNASAVTWRNILLAERKDPRQMAGFTVGSRWIRDTNGVRWPIWRPLHNPGRIRINDLFPQASLIELGLDRYRVYRIVALDYDHAGRTLRITPDVMEGEQRLDVILQRLGADGIGQYIARQAE